MDIQETLSQRNEQYGDFEAQSLIAQGFKRLMRANGRWGQLKPDQQEALDHISVKLSRILNGNPDHFDSWHDLAGYSTLVANRLRKPAKPTQPEVD